MENIKQSYFNLIMIATTMRSFWISKVAIESFLISINAEDGDYEQKYLTETIRNFHQQAIPIKAFLTIQTCSFLEEYKKIFKILPSDAKLRDDAILFKSGLKAILKPAIALINNSWKDLYDVRNNLFAHNWRKDDKLIMFSNMTDKPSNSPWIDEEFTLLIGIFDIIIYYLKKYKPDFFEEMHSSILEKNNKKVHHRSRVTTHDASLELLEALKVIMEYELSRVKY